MPPQRSRQPSEPAGPGPAQVHMELSKGDWNVHKNWLMGLKRMLPRCPRD